MSLTLSLTEDQTLEALRTFIQSVIGTDVEVILGQDNRVAEPVGPGFVVMTPMFQERLSTNVTTNDDGAFSLPVVAGVRNDLSPTKHTIQLDVHGPQSANWARMIAVMFFSDFAVDKFASTGYDVAPLYAGEPHQTAFENGEQQIENSWSLDAVMQCNPVVTSGQDFMASIALGLVSVDVETLPSPGLAVQGAYIVGPDKVPVQLRGWNWGHWGSAIEQDAIDAANQNAGIIRLPLRWWGLYGGNGIDSRLDSAVSTALINPANLAILDANVAWCVAHGRKIHLFIDSNCGQNGFQDGPGGLTAAYCDPLGLFPNGKNFWSSPADRAKFIAVWQFIAARYKKWIAIFEPLPEPGPPTGSAQDIIDFYDQVMSAIRLVAPGIPFMVGPVLYKSTQMSTIYNPAWKDVIYTCDLFWQTGGTASQNAANWTARLQDLVNFGLKHNVPVFCQQIGVRTGDDPDQSILLSMLTQIVAARVGFEYWEFVDAGSPNEFGPWYYDANGNRALKPFVLSTIVPFFSAP